MRMEGLIPFVFGAIKRWRATRRTMHYDLISSPGASPAAVERLTGGAYNSQLSQSSQSQSCRFVVQRSLAYELHLLRDDDDDDGRGLSARSRRFSSMRVLGCVSDDVTSRNL